MNPVGASRTTASPTFDPTSKNYHKELNQAGFITDTQLAAITSGDGTKIRNADNEALALTTFIDQRPLTKKQSETINPAFLEQQRRRDTNLTQKYTQAGYTFASNNGKDNNCLIISLLQHMTGDYQSEHTKKASEYRTKIDAKLKDDLINAETNKFEEKSMLVADDIHWLLREMNKDAGLSNKNLAITLWMANENGDPVSFSFGNTSKKAIIFQQAAHFVAVIPPTQNNSGTGSTTPAPALVPVPSANCGSAQSSANAQLKSTKETGDNDGNSAIEATDLDISNENAVPTSLDKAVSNEELHGGQRINDKLLKEKFTKAGYRFFDSKIENHNCLITSILQHATSNYSENHHDLAIEYRKKLNEHLMKKMTPEQKNKFLENDLLDRDHTDWLLKEIAKDSRIKIKNLAVEIWVADEKGEPVRISYGEGEGKIKAIIFNSTDHYEAVMMPPDSTTAENSATTKISSRPDGTKEQSLTVDESLKFFGATRDPLKQETDN